MPTLKAMFGNMGSIRPNAIVIDKDKTKRIAVLKVIKEDRFCWKDEQIGDSNKVLTSSMLVPCKKNMGRALITKSARRTT